MGNLKKIIRMNFMAVAIVYPVKRGSLVLQQVIERAVYPRLVAASRVVKLVLNLP